MSVFKLDLYEFYYLNKKARFNKTKALLMEKKKYIKENLNSAKHNKKFLIPLGLETQVAQREIESIKQQMFEHKVHNGLVQFKRVLKKIMKGNKLRDDKELRILEGFDVEKFSKTRVVKIVSKIFNLKDLEKNKFIQVQWIIDAVLDKDNEYNPSKFYNSLNKEEQNFISKILNNKELKKTNDSVDLSFKLILGPVVSKKDDAELKTIEKESGIDDERLVEDSDSEEDQSEDEETMDRDAASDEIFDMDLSQYDALVGATDDEEEDGQGGLDAEIDYNQVTDEEPSEEEQEEEVDDDDDDDDFFVEEPSKKKEKKEKKEKLKLPELATGYYSGGEGSDIEPDALVEEITKPQRKNRRGQRARQKIWEQKYGGGANHVKKEKTERIKQREQKQKEWEERERKRQEKVANSSLGGPSQEGGKTSKQMVHPSWEAKMKQKEQMKNVKFEGKKMKFD